MPEFYFDNDIKLGHLQGSVAGVPVPRVPGLAVSEVQAPDSDSPRKCGCKGVSEDVASALTMLVEDLDDEAKNGTKAEGEMQLERERQMAAASYLRDELISDRAGLVLASARRSQEQTSPNSPSRLWTIAGSQSSRLGRGGEDDPSVGARWPPAAVAPCGSREPGRPAGHRTAQTGTRGAQGLDHRSSPAEEARGWAKPLPSKFCAPARTRPCRSAW